MNGSRDALEIRTPEGIVFTLPLAGPLTRFLAWGVDLAAIGATTSLLASLMTALGFVLGDVARALYAIFYFALSIGYGMACEWLLRGQTLGKWLLGLRVVDEQGLRLEPHQILVRNLLRVVDSLPVFYLVGGAAMFLSRRSQRLGDYAANTVVIRATQPSLAYATSLKAKLPAERAGN